LIRQNNRPHFCDWIGFRLNPLYSSSQYTLVFLKPHDFLRSVN